MGALNEAKSSCPRVGAIVVAAGQSRRMQGTDKIFYPLNGMPLVWHSISALLSHPSINEIVLVTSEENIKQAVDIATARGLGGSVRICVGGERRQDSVRIGIENLNECDFVVVHDGARPFLDTGLLDRGMSAALESGAAIAAVPVKDTIKVSDSEDLVSQTIPRDKLWSVQTPQIFRTSLLEKAHRSVQGMVTDDASMVEAIGHPVRLFFGSYYNIKVTTPEDLTIAKAIANRGSGEDSETV